MFYFSVSSPWHDYHWKIGQHLRPRTRSIGLTRHWSMWLFFVKETGVEQTLFCAPQSLFSWMQTQGIICSTFTQQFTLAFRLKQPRNKAGFKWHSGCQIFSLRNVREISKCFIIFEIVHSFTHLFIPQRFYKWQRVAITKLIKTGYVLPKLTARWGKKTWRETVITISGIPW